MRARGITECISASRHSCSVFYARGLEIDFFPKGTKKQKQRVQPERVRTRRPRSQATVLGITFPSTSDPGACSLVETWLCTAAASEHSAVYAKSSTS